MSEISPAFIKACGGLHQDIGLSIETPEQLADAALEYLDERERTELRNYLRRILAGRIEGASLRNLWRAAGSDVYFPKAEDLLSFLMLVQKRLG